jgi:AefR-like transcriptional repressor, C-terminal domain
MGFPAISARRAAGPAKGIKLLGTYIAAQVEAGVLMVEDCEVAAAQLMEAYQAMLFKSMAYNFIREPSPQQIDRVVPTAVKVFLAA